MLLCFAIFFMGYFVPTGCCDLDLYQGRTAHVLIALWSSQRCGGKYSHDDSARMLILEITAGALALSCVQRGGLMHCAFMLLFLTISLLWPINAEARNRALLIGISEYQLDTIPKLKAPKNDVALMWDLLHERGFDLKDITVLADQIDPDHKQPIPHGMPTANNILRELDALAAKTKNDDLIVIYYSGHGTYIRQRTPKIGETVEQSGFNQVLLAINAQKSDEIKAEVPGGILDKILKTKFDAIKQKKAFLWLILDSCHAGGLTRDVTVDAAVHFVPPSLLNLDDTPPLAGTDPNRWIAGGLGGRQVAFLAAPENSPAFEKPVSDLGNKPYSLFTLSLVRLLEAENFRSYRSLGEAVISKQTALPGKVPSPIIEGDLDQPIFEGSIAGPRLWNASYDQTSNKILIDAGSLQGIAAGAIVSLETTHGLIGYGQVESSDTLSSQAHPIAFQDKSSSPADFLKEKQLIARVVRSTIDLSLNVAVPPVADMDGRETSRTGLRAIELLQKEQQDPLPIRWLAPGGSADVYLRLIDGVIYLVPGTGELVRKGRRQTPGVEISASAQGTADNLKENVWHILRQLNLRRAADAVQSNDFAKAVDVHLGLVRDDAEFQAVIRNEKQPCRSWERDLDAIPSRLLDPDTMGNITLTQCDRVKVELVNRWPKPVDVTLLYLDSEGGIGEVDETRVDAGMAYRPHKVKPVQIVTWCDAKVWGLCKSFKTAGDQPIGAERLLVIIREARATKHTYYYLTQERLSKAVEIRDKVKRAGGVPLEELLMDAGLYPRQARSIVDTAAPGTIKLYTWDVVPPAELARR